MHCPTPETLDQYVTGHLSEAAVEGVEAHLRNCAACQQRVIEARNNETLLQQLKDLPPVPVPLHRVPVSRATVNTVEQARRLIDERYRILEPAGHDPGHAVFHARDTVLDRHVAVKFLPDDTNEDWQEARCLGQLNHPAIAQVYEIGTTAPYRFVVMEWVDGPSLTAAWRDFDRNQRLALFLDVVNGVAAAHRQGIIHRDLKPSNIRVTSDGKPKILDFGIACRTADPVATDLYQGTPAYSAPEQFAAPVYVSPATDVYALGVLLYELLTDTHPFADVAPADLFDAIERTWPRLPRAVVQDVPMALQNICLKALEKVPSRRYADAADLARDIERYRRGERVWSRPSFLVDNLQQTLFPHQQTLSVWRDNDLLTGREYDRLERIYRLLLPLASLGFVFGSVTRQMKSFFFSGLAGIAFSVQRITAAHLSVYFVWPVGLVGSGLAFMFASCLVPRWQARRKNKPLPKPDRF